MPEAEIRRTFRGDECIADLTDEELQQTVRQRKEARQREAEAECRERNTALATAIATVIQRSTSPTSPSAPNAGARFLAH